MQDVVFIQECIECLSSSVVWVLSYWACSQGMRLPAVFAMFRLPLRGRVNREKDEKEGKQKEASTIMQKVS